MSDFEFAIENEKEFIAQMTRLQRLGADLRIPFRLISSDFYRSQEIIFGLKSPGLYPPLGGFNPDRIVAGVVTARQRAEDTKKRQVGFAYPLLVRKNSAIKDSTLSPNHPNSVYFLGRSELIIGTNVEYAKYHQDPKNRPRTKIPERRFVFIDGGPNDASKSSRISGRRERWRDIINTHYKQIIEGKI